MHHINIEAARREMDKRGLDILIAASVTNSCYCTGHYSKIWESLRDHLRLVVIPKDSDPFVTSPDVEAKSFAASGVFEVFEYPIDVYVKYHSGDDLYLKAQNNIKDIDTLKGLNVRELLARSPVLLAKKVLKSRGFQNGRIGIDKEYVQAAFCEEVERAFSDCEIVDGTPLLLDLRAVKSAEEIGNMTEAVNITEKAIKDCEPLIKKGATLFDIQQHFVKQMSLTDGSEIGHILISVSPTPVGQVMSSMKDELREGQVFKIDVGARYHNYNADISRQWVMGKIPQEVRDIFNSITEAFDAMVDRLRPGTPISDLFSTGSAIMRKIDPDYERRLFLGHSIGMEDHERPYITPYTHDVLVPGMVFCIEVPYYIAGGYSFNLEDEFLITEEGHRLLSSSIPRDIVEM